ncbi:MAG TPA: glycosyltransferase family 39 protein [Pyrinomonadaceae bacterium]|nr:glycosyltransferase family 39 protein [Pyrinomonadaceae bacterium]
MKERTTQARETVAAGGVATAKSSRFSLRRAFAAHADETLCALLLLALAFNLFTIIRLKSITTDEIVLIPSAYAYVTGGDTQLVHEHPPLVKLLAGLPLVSLQPPLKVLPEQGGAPPRTVAQMQTRVGRFWEDNRAAVERVSFIARLPLIALTVALGVLIFVFARGVFGSRAALFAVALFSTEPTVLAHGRVVQTDIAAAFGYLLLCYAVYAYALAPSSKRALLAGAAAALAILAKFSMLLVAPIVGAVFVVLLWRARRQGGKRSLTIAAHAGLVALTTLFLIHAAYLFHNSPLLETDAQWITSTFAPDNSGAMLNAARVLSYVLPVDFVLGVFWQAAHNGRGHPASLLGMYSNTGWWYYYPVAFALKTTLPFLLLSLASLAWGVWRAAKKRERQLLIFLIPFFIYTAFVLLSRINIGVRYYLPAYPLLFILGGALVARLLEGQRHSARVFIVIALLGWIGVEAVRAYPDQMTYMNQLASREPRWHYLSDSNVEWGDDVRALAEYLHARGETRVRAATLAGDHMLPCYGIENLNLITPVAVQWPPTRYVAIGASFLNGSTVPPGVIRGQTLTEAERVNYFDAYRRRTPEAIIGGSIYVFREQD